MSATVLGVATRPRQTDIQRGRNPDSQCATSVEQQYQILISRHTLCTQHSLIHVTRRQESPVSTPGDDSKKPWSARGTSTVMCDHPGVAQAPRMVCSSLMRTIITPRLHGTSVSATGWGLWGFGFFNFSMPLRHPVYVPCASARSPGCN